MTEALKHQISTSLNERNSFTEQRVREADLVASLTPFYLNQSWKVLNLVIMTG